MLLFLSIIFWLGFLIGLFGFAVLLMAVANVPNMSSGTGFSLLQVGALLLIAFATLCTATGTSATAIIPFH